MEQLKLSKKDILRKISYYSEQIDKKRAKYTIEDGFGSNTKMEIKIVKRPSQDEHTKPEEIQYLNEKWCVRNFMYYEGDGGLNLWFKELERVKPDVVYLYEIKAWKDEIVNDIIYSVRADFKKFLT